MPRTGKRTQPIRAPQDQGYGERGDQIAAQQAMPLPDNRSLPQNAPAPAGTDPGRPGAGVDPVQAALQGAAALPPAGILTSPGDPQVPVTAGLGVGAGPGPEVLGDDTPKRKAVLQEIARLTDDPALVRLINRAVQR